MGQDRKHWLNEADIGSGEKSVGQQDVERDEGAMKDASPHSDDNRSEAASNANNGRILQQGNHLARIVAVKQPDETFEAQVFVRLTREPEVAETYIPAGTFPTEEEAWGAAEERARRAFDEREF